MSFCPYFECRKVLGPATGDRACSSCRRLLRRCAGCRTENRRLARFCRVCGGALGDDAEDWTGQGGGPERRALSRFALKALTEVIPMSVERFRLDDACAGLLFYDGYFLAVSQSGQVDAIDLAEPGRHLRLSSQMQLRTKPCLERSRLFLADDRNLAAFSLAALDSATPSLEPCWSVPLEGLPTQAPICSADRLFLSVRRADGQEALTMVDGVAGQPASCRTLAVAERFSGMVAAPSRPLVALGERQGRVFLQRLFGDEQPPRPADKTLEALPGSFADHVPPAAIGKKLFAVLGDEDQLCRLDDDGTFELALRDDIRSFALGGLNDGVAIDSQGLFFLRSGHFEPLAPGLRVLGQPLILRDCAAVIGLQDGRLRLHDLANPPFFRELRLGTDPTEGVSMLAASRNFLAAGGTGGSVHLFRLAAKAGETAS